MKETTFIYTLSDPRNGLVRYVGKSNDPRTRYRGHLYTKRSRCRKSKWINFLKKNNLSPIIDIIDEVPYCDWASFERKYILLFKSIGARLLNDLPGGEAGGPLSEKTKIKIGNANRGLKRSDEVKSRQSIMRFGKKNPLARAKNMVIGMDRNTSPVIQYNLDGTEIGRYKSMAEAGRVTGVNRYVIAQVCNPNTINKTAGGFKWSYQNKKERKDNGL